MLARTLHRGCMIRSIPATTTTSILSSTDSTPTARRETRRGKFVVKRRWWLPHIPDLEDVSKYPYDEHERGDFHVYDVVERTHKQRRPDIKLIMKEYLEGYGDIGDVITVPVKDARNFLLPARLALYDTEENRKEISDLLIRLNLQDRVQRTPFAAVTARDLAERFTLPVVMHPTNPWTLNVGHVTTALRKVGVVVEKSSCVELPEEPISKPGPFTFHLTINEVDRVPVKGVVLIWRIDMDGHLTHDNVEIWARPKEKPKQWRVSSAQPVKKVV